MQKWFSLFWQQLGASQGAQNVWFYFALSLGGLVGQGLLEKNFGRKPKSSEGGVLDTCEQQRDMIDFRPWVSESGIAPCNVCVGQ